MSFEWSLDRQGGKNLHLWNKSLTDFIWKLFSLNIHFSWWQSFCYFTYIPFFTMRYKGTNIFLLFLAKQYNKPKTPGVNFINIFMRSFCTPKSRKRKKTDNLTVFFMLLGSEHVNSVGRMLMKLTPGKIFLNTTFNSNQTPALVLSNLKPCCHLPC